MKFKLSLVVVLVLSIFFVFNTVFAMTEQERQILILQLQEQIAQLTQQLNQMITEQEKIPASWCHTFSKNLGYADSNTAEVGELHTALGKQGFSFSPDTGNTYAEATASAVAGFQEKYASEILTPYGLPKSTGYVGPSTRNKLNQLYGCSPVSLSSFRCTENNWTYTLSPTTCPSTGTQTKTWTKIGTCEGGVNHPATETVSCSYQTSVCTSFTYSNWSVCTQSGVQTRTVTSSSPSGCTGGNPITSQACTVTSCNPNWQCTEWSACASNNKTRTCTDINNCFTDEGKPEETEYCSINKCQQPNVSGLNISCVYGLSPYNTDEHIEMDKKQLDSLVASFHTYSPERSCGCSWYGLNDDTMIKLSCPSSKAGCDFTKVPDELSRRMFDDYCTSFSEVDYVELSSRLAKGESLEQAYQNTIENQKLIGLETAEVQCLKKMIDEYYIGGESGYPSWMCPGEKYRQNPNVSKADWQKWVNGLWVSKFVDDCPTVNPNPTCGSSSVACEDSTGKYWHSCKTNQWQERYVCENNKCVKKDYHCNGGCSYGSCVSAAEATCTDSDGGTDGTWNFLEKGECKDNIGNPLSPSSYLDTCVDENTIYEKYCGLDSKFGPACLTKTYRCPWGCENGACLPQPNCTPNWQCTEWSECINGWQTRTCTDLNNCGVPRIVPLGITQDKATPGSQVEKQICTSTTSCTENNWTYTLSPTTCPSTGTQTKTWTKIGTCSGGVNHPATETVSCSYQTSVCASFTYSNWSVCTQSGVQTRTVTSSSPSGCTGGNPITSQACTFAPCRINWQCSLWSICVNGKQTRTCTDLNNCGTTIFKPDETQDCSSWCTPNWQCPDWGPCVNDKQTRDCSDLNSCNGITLKTQTQHPCKWANCTPNWYCNDWSQCVAGSQFRTCTDTNMCEGRLITNKETRSCVCTPNWQCGPCVDYNRICSDVSKCDKGNLTRTERCGDFSRPTKCIAEYQSAMSKCEGLCNEKVNECHMSESDKEEVIAMIKVGCWKFERMANFGNGTCANIYANPYCGGPARSVYKYGSLVSLLTPECKATRQKCKETADAAYSLCLRNN